MIDTDKLPFVAATLLLAGALQAQCIPDPIQDQWNGGTNERNFSGYSEWRSFTSGTDGALIQVDLLFCNANIILNGRGTHIYNGEGPLLATRTVSLIGTAYTMNQPLWRPWTVNPPPMLMANAVYLQVRS